MRKVNLSVSNLLVFCVIAALAPAAQAFDGCRAADVNGDGSVSGADLTQILGAFGTSDARKDLDGGGTVDDPDVSILLSFWGSCATSCPADFNDSGSVDGDDRDDLEAAIILAPDCRFDLDRDDFVDDDDTDLLLDYWGAGPLSAARSRADFDGDDDVDGADLVALLSNITAPPKDCRFDLNKDGVVDTNDIWALLASWGNC